MRRNTRFFACLYAVYLACMPVVALADDVGVRMLGPLDGSRETFIYDEFVGQNITSGQIGQLGWNTNTSGGGSCTYTLIAPATPAIRPGLIGVNTGTTINTVCALSLYFTPGIANAQLVKNQQCFSFRSPSSTTSMIVRVGISSDQTGLADPPVAGGWLEYDTSLGDTTWFFVVKNLVAERTNLNIPYESSQFYYYCIEGLGNDQTVKVRWNPKNSGQTWTITSPEVLGLTTDWAPIFQVKALAASSRTIHIDYYSMYAEQSAGRSSK